jgi:hypothetical protein
MSASQPKECQMSGLVNDKLVKMWRGPVGVQVEVMCRHRTWEAEVMCRHRTGEAEETHKETQFSRCPARDSNRTACERTFRHSWNQIPEFIFRNFQTASVVPSSCRLVCSLWNIHFISQFLVSQGCTNPGQLNFVRWRLACVCRPAVCNWLHIVLLAPRILRWLLDFLKALGPPFWSKGIYG